MGGAGGVRYSSGHEMGMKILLKIFQIMFSRLLSRRSISIVLMIVLSGGFVVYQVYTDDERVRVMAQEYFTMKAGRCVHIESASFSLFGAIELRKVAAPAPPGSDAPSLTVELISAKHNPWSLLTGSLDVTDILCVKPVVTIIRRMGPTSRPAPPPSDPEAPPASLPPGMSLRVRDGLVRVASFDTAGAESITEVPIGAVVTPEKSAYRILFGQQDPAGLHGQASIAYAEARLETLDVSVTVESLVSMLPAELRDNVRKYAPAGILRVGRGVEPWRPRTDRAGKASSREAWRAGEWLLAAGRAGKPRRFWSRHGSR